MLKKDTNELDRLQREHGLTYKEARVLLSDLSGETNAELAAEFGVGLHAIYNLRRRARKKVGDDPKLQYQISFCDVETPDTVEISSRILDDVTSGASNIDAGQYAIGILRLQEIAGLTFEEAQAYMCSCGYEDPEILMERMGILPTELNSITDRARKKVSDAESSGGLVIRSR